MALTLHGFDGREVDVEPATILSISETRIGGRVCTRIGLQSGDDVVVRERASVVQMGLAEAMR